MNKIHIPINITATPPKIRKVRRKARHSHNDSGSLHLIPLPLGLGLYYGKGFGDCSPAVRSWEWARFDYADHSPRDSERWSWVQLGRPVQAAHPFAAWFDAWDERRFWKRMARKAARR